MSELCRLVWSLLLQEWYSHDLLPYCAGRDHGRRKALADQIKESVTRL